MCGIVGLLIKDRSAGNSLGELLVPMFECMAQRGPDSAGLAVYTAPQAGLRRYSLFSPHGDLEPAALARSFTGWTGQDCQVDSHGNHAVMITPAQTEETSDWLDEQAGDVFLLAAGRSMDIYKDEGHPSDIARRYRFDLLQGSHCVGHTRMATESAVSPAHAHPFTAGDDFCLVHNGSLSNPYMLRRKLEAEGLTFETDNDTEAACRWIEWRLRQGDDLDQALRAAATELDGFYTLLMATADQLTLVRDAFACKPAVVAETPGYVAVASEFRSLAHLPGIDQADVFEPEPLEIYSWQR